ncbi:MAG: hypothetical protein KJP10_07335 [Gammaproteobacteria bacterium]|nr:hypothetical protein [Gammaproteobacteria bacterium]
MITLRHLISPTFLLLVFWGLQASATSLLPVSPQRMTMMADNIFHGQVIDNTVRIDPVSGRVATFTTFKVLEVIKGDIPETNTIKQIGGQLPGSQVRQLIQGVPRFETGAEYVVFMPAASSLGFASPIGLKQGKYDIRRLNGEAVISNARGFSSVANTASQQAAVKLPSAVEFDQSAAQADTLPLADFLQSVRGMIEE